MPQVRIQCSEEWWNRLQATINATIDTCVGLTSQIANHQINGAYDAEELLDRIEGQLRDLRRNVEAVQIPF